MGIRSTAQFNVPLTSYAYGIMQDSLASKRLANLLCPIVQVAAATGTYKKYDDRNSFLVEDDARALGGPRIRVKHAATDGTYAVKPRGREIGLDDFEVDLAGGLISSETQAQLKITTLLSGKATAYAKRVADFVFANLTAVADRGVWSNPDIDPIDQIDEQLDALSLDVASTENINLIMSVSEWRALRNNANVKKRLGLSGNMSLTREKFLDALLFPVQLEISGVASTGTKRGQTTVTKARVMSGYCVLAYTSPNATTDDASAFKCFSTSSVLVDGVKTYREEQSNSEIHSMDWNEDIQKTGAACARLLAIS